VQGGPQVPATVPPAKAAADSKKPPG